MKRTGPPERRTQLRRTGGPRQKSPQQAVGAPLPPRKAPSRSPGPVDGPPREGGREHGPQKALCLGCRRVRWCAPHHYVYQQEMRRRGGDVEDPATVIPLCLDCHRSHHDRVRVLPVTALPDHALDYAFRLLGAFAYDYLRRRYRGDDPRLHARLALAEASP